MNKEYKLCPFNTTTYTKPFGEEISFNGISSTISRGLSNGHKTETVFEICIEEQCMAWDDKKKLCKKLK